MNREQAEKLLAALVFDDLDESSKAELLAYLQTDDDLRDRLADMRMAVKLTCDAVNEGPDPVLADRRLKKLKRLAGTPKGGLRVFTLRPILAAAAVLVVGVVLIGLLMPSLSRVRQLQTRSESARIDSLAEHVRASTPRVASPDTSRLEVLGDKHPVTRSGGLGGMGGMGTVSSTTEGGRGATYGGGMMGGMGGTANRSMASGTDMDGEALIDGPADTAIALSDAAASLSTQLPSDALTVHGRSRHAAESYGYDGFSVNDEAAVRLGQQIDDNRLDTGQTEFGLSGRMGMGEAAKSIAKGEDRYGDTLRTPGLPNERLAAETAPSLPGAAASSSYRVRGPSADRLLKELKSVTPMRDSSTGGSVSYDGSVSYEWSGPVATSKPAVPTSSPVPSQSAPTSQEKSDTELDLLSGFAATNGRAPALGETPIADALPRLQSLDGKDSEAQGGRQEERGKDKRPANTASVATKTDQVAVLDREAAVAVQAVPELNTTLESFAPQFTVVPVNPWVMTERDALSTFALDVDTASYAICRRYIRSGFLPPIGAVRMEEFVNAFDYAYPQRDGATFAVYAEGAPSPFAPAGQDLTLLKIAVKARTVGRDQRRAAHIVFVVDASASMGQPDRLPLVQSALSLLVDKLSDADRISLVTCAERARLHLEAVSARQRDTIRQTIDAVQSAGPTNLLAGIKVGYAMARRAFIAGQINQVVLCSDGVANVGQTEADGVLAEVADDRRQGITLTCVGVGYGAYNDAFLEALADRGDGRYVFLDSSEEARETLVGQLDATLQTVAKDARIQVRFNPARVRRYRLIGYENRDIEDRRFRDDTVDAGEVGSGQCSTALYEMELANPAAGEGDSDLGTVFVRYRNADTEQIEEISRPLAGSLIRRRSVEEDPRFFLAAGVARFAEWLRQSEHARDTSPAEIQEVLDLVSAVLPLDQNVRDLAVLVHQAEDLPRATQTQRQP